MKKLLPFMLILALSITTISALDLDVQEEEISNILIKELNESAFYELDITNIDPVSERFQIFSYVGVEISPREFTIVRGSSDTISITAHPSQEIRDKQEDWFSFEYRIAGQEPGTYRDTLKFKIVPLAELVEFYPAYVFPDREEIIIEIRNSENRPVENLNLNMVSDFFDSNQEISLKPYETINLSVEINKDIRNLEAGQYDYDIQLSLEDAQASTSAEINYLEKDGLLTTTETSGLISKTTIIEKINAGNVPTTATITQTKNILTRLFTTHSEIPLTTERSGFLVEYTWERTLGPNESIRITSRTNYTIPLIILILIILAIILARYYTRSNLILRKRVHFVKTKGGEFALKVRIKVKAKKSIKDIEIMDRIPGMTKVHEKFGTKPDKFNEKSRMVHWNIPKLNAGEERTISYLIYSKIKIVGTFDLPIATASYKLDNKTHYTSSNKTSFAAEGS